MAITPPIMTYPLGTDYYDVEIFNTNWKNSLTYLDNNFLNDERVLSEQLSTSTTDVLSAEASNKLFENGVGADVLGYIEDGGTHNVGEVWLSKNNIGEFECKIQNSDNYVESTKWKKIDDKSNSDRLDNLLKLIYPSYTLGGVFNAYNKSFINGKVINIGIGSSGLAYVNLSVGDTCLVFENMVCETGAVMIPFSSNISKGGVITFALSETGIVKVDAIFNVNGDNVTTTGSAPSFYANLVSVLK